ncbi:OmpA family protein [Frigidibacter sp. MR17.14]|uniref:OmpA family protein n=1 Tax=Frigidibacter sp. MR17.14 TaxID=3126509 RepID=UPI003012E4B2
MTFRYSILLALAGATALTACQQAAPFGYTNTQPNNTRNAAIAGAVLGGALGATADGDERLTKAAAGALVGAGIGAVAGSFLDRQASELQNSIGGNGTTVVNNGSNLIVNMPQDVLFSVDSTTVSSGATQSLYELGASLNRYPNSTVQIIGHTDSTGSDAYNMDLSQRRASSVAAILVQSGVSAGRVTPIGRGESQPIASNESEAGRAQNRRVQIVITPTQ